MEYLWNMQIADTWTHLQACNVASPLEEEWRSMTPNRNGITCANQAVLIHLGSQGDENYKLPSQVSHRSYSVRLLAAAKNTLIMSLLMDSWQWRGMVWWYRIGWEHWKLIFGGSFQPEKREEVWRTPLVSLSEAPGEEWEVWSGCYEYDNYFHIINQAQI